jgi:hypothetical protein
VQVAGQFGEADVIGVKAGHDLTADLPYRAVVITEKPRVYFLLARAAAFLSRAHQRHLAPDVFAQQLVGLQQVVLVVLLEHAYRSRLRQRAEVDSRRVHGGGDVHELQIEGAGRKRQVPHVAHQRDVGVVNGDREVCLVRQRGGLGSCKRFGGSDGGGGAGA